MAPDTKHQFAEGTNDSVGNTRLLNSNLDDKKRDPFVFLNIDLDRIVLNGTNMQKLKLLLMDNECLTVTVAPFRQSVSNTKKSKT